MTGGRVERVERHARRLARDAERLGLARPALREVEALFLQTATETFGDGDGVIRVEWSMEDQGPLELIATPRAVGDEPAVWRAAESKATHPGPEHRRNTKYVDVHAYDLARAEVGMDDSSVNEVLLFDADGLLVEGGRSNFLVVTESGQLVTPDPALGGVEGLGLTIVLETGIPISPARLRRDDVANARELLSVNIVRGTIPIVELNGRPVSDGQPGSWANRLGAIFS